MSLAVDLDPCHRYDWPDTPCAVVYSGAHVCGLGAGHVGACVCAQCGRGRAETRAKARMRRDLARAWRRLRDRRWPFGSEWPHGDPPARSMEAARWRRRERPADMLHLADLSGTLAYVRAVLTALPADDAAEREAEAWIRASRPPGKRRLLTVRPPAPTTPSDTCG